MKRNAIRKSFVLIGVVLAALSFCLTGCSRTYSVEFKIDELDIITQSVKNGENAYMPWVDTADGIFIEGWYESDDFSGEKFDFAAPVERNITLYPKYRNIEYDVVFDLNYEGAAKLSDVVFTRDGLMKLPETPERTGYDFLGWSDGNKIYNAGETIETENFPLKDAIFSARWQTSCFKVEFVGADGDIIDIQTVPYGGNALPDNEKAVHPLACFELDGWRGDYTNVDGDRTIEAVYEYVPSDLSYFDFEEIKNEDGEIVAYTLGMAVEETGITDGYEWTIYKKVDKSGLWALPDRYNGKPVVGFTENYSMEMFGFNFEEGDFDIDLYIPDSFTSIGKKIISCWKVNNIYIGKGLNHIDENAFAHEFAFYIGNFIVNPENPFFASDGMELTSKDGKTLIFTDKNVEEYTVGDKVEYIYPNVFFQSPVLKKVNVSGDLEKIGAGAFAGCPLIAEVNFDGKVKVLADGDDCSVTMDAFGRFNFGVFAFSPIEILKLNGIEYIGFGAFTECSALTSLTLDSALKYVSDEAFVGLSNLARLSLTENETGGNFRVYDNVLFEKEGSDIDVNTGTKGDKLLLYAAAQTHAEYLIPDNVRSFGQFAFSGASNLKRVTIPEGVEKLPAGLFLNCGLTSAVIPSSVKEMSNGNISAGSSLTDFSPVFYGCPLESVIFAAGSTLTHIPEYAFAKNNLKKIDIPESAESVHVTGLQSQTLQSVTVAAGNENFAVADGVLYNADFTELILFPAGKESENFIVPSTVEKIGDYAFYQAGNIRRVVLDNGLKQIGTFAFAESALEEIIIAETVEKIDVTAFVMCSALRRIELKMSEPCEVTDIQNFDGMFMLFEVEEREFLNILVPEAGYDAFFAWLNEYTDNYGMQIDTSGYEHAAEYVFADGDNITVVKAKVLLRYPIPQWTGDGVKYFQGWFTKDGTDGDFGEELAVPSVKDDDTSNEYYAKWGDRKRRDGTTEWFAYEIGFSNTLTVTVSENATVVYFEAQIEVPESEFGGVLLILSVNGVESGYLELTKDEIPPDGLYGFSFDFALLDGSAFSDFPARVELDLACVII